MIPKPYEHRTDLHTAEDIARERLALMEYRELREQVEAGALGPNVSPAGGWRVHADRVAAAITARAVELGLEDLR